MSIGESYTKQKLRDKTNEDVMQFLEAGNKIEHIPPGVTTEDSPSRSKDIDRDVEARSVNTPAFTCFPCPTKFFPRKRP